MSNDIEQLKQDFLCYINFLVFPSPEILVEKIISAFQETKLEEITFESNFSKDLPIKGKDGSVITLSKNDLGEYGFSVENFRKGIKEIKNKDPKKIFSAAVEEVIILYNKNLCETYVPSAILVYTKLYEKFKLENPKIGRNERYNLIDKAIESLLTDKMSLTYNYFKRAYQGYANSTGFTSLRFAREAENLKLIFNITKKLKINFTPYQSTYASLINLFEKFYICAINKQAAQTLIEELKYQTNSSFSNLIQKSFEKQDKTIIKDFKSTAQKLIKDYIENHPNECKKQRGILDYLLGFITKILPESIFSENKRMALFGKYTETGRKIKSLSDQVIKETVNLLYRD